MCGISRPGDSGGGVPTGCGTCSGASFGYRGSVAGTWNDPATTAACGSWPTTPAKCGCPARTPRRACRSDWVSPAAGCPSASIQSGSHPLPRLEYADCSPCHISRRTRTMRRSFERLLASRRRPLCVACSIESDLTETDMVTAYRTAEVVVCPSTFEGFGLTPMEAIATATPVVAADGAARAGPPPAPDVLSGVTIDAAAERFSAGLMPYLR